MMTKKILVTGGAGAIGSSLAHKLSRDFPDYYIVVLDDLSSGYIKNIENISNINFIEGSILDDDLLSELFKDGYEYIFHLAALFANQKSVEHPETDLAVNSLGTLKLLNFARQVPKLKKFVYTSSSCVYGNSQKEAMHENDTLKPGTPYAISKLAGEHYASFFYSNYSLPLNIARLFNIYGSNEYPGRYRNVIPNFMYKAMHNEDITVMGEGKDTRDFTHIDDALDMLLGIAFDDSNFGETYNIGSGSKYTIIELAELIIALISSKSKITFVPKRDWDDITNRRADIKKVRKYLDREHKKLDEGLGTVHNFINRIKHEVHNDHQY